MNQQDQQHQPRKLSQRTKNRLKELGVCIILLILLKACMYWLPEGAAWSVLIQGVLACAVVAMLFHILKGPSPPERDENKIEEKR